MIISHFKQRKGGKVYFYLCIAIYNYLVKLAANILYDKGDCGKPIISF